MDKARIVEPNYYKTTMPYQMSVTVALLVAKFGGFRSCLQKLWEIEKKSKLQQFRKFLIEIKWCLVCKK